MKNKIKILNAIRELSSLDIKLLATSGSKKLKKKKGTVCVIDPVRCGRHRRRLKLSKKKRLEVILKNSSSLYRGISRETVKNKIKNTNFQIKCFMKRLRALNDFIYY